MKEKKMSGIGHIDNKPIIICPGCGYQNKLSELVWKDGIAKCTGKTCDWKFRIIFEDSKTERPVKPERMDHMEKGAKIGKSREGTTTKELAKKLAKKYVEIWKKYEKSSAWNELDEKKLEAQVDLLDDIFEEFFGIKDLYVDDNRLMSGGKKIS